MGSRLELQQTLESIEGLQKVYYQPPESVRLKYPCVIYELSKKPTKYANNSRYMKHARYLLKLIEKEADSPITDRILDCFDYCSIDRLYTSNNLYHTVFTLDY